MTPIIKKLSRLFGGGSDKKEYQEAESRQDRAARIAEEIRSKSEDSVPKSETQPDSAPAPAITPPPMDEMLNPEPVRRTVIQAPVIVESEETPNDGKIRIKAQPSRDGESCKFMVNRDLFPGHSWFFDSFESAEGSPLAERLFSTDDVEALILHGSTVTVTRKEKGHGDWEPKAREIGQLIRETLAESDRLVSEKIVSEMPSSETIRNDIQKVIDDEVNPGVAGHGGRITLTQVEGNTVTIEMGGGCQGCSAADLTLKQGIHNAFRKAVPFVGAIYDETDHAAGQNPYYS